MKSSYLNYVKLSWRVCSSVTSGVGEPSLASDETCVNRRRERKLIKLLRTTMRCTSRKHARRGFKYNSFVTKSNSGRVLILCRWYFCMHIALYPYQGVLRYTAWHSIAFKNIFEEMRVWISDQSEACWAETPHQKVV